MAAHRMTLNEYLALEYPFNVMADPDGGYVIVFPDLPGCMTVADDVDEIGPMAEDARVGWIESAYEHGMDIPLPSQPETYSGKFNVRLPSRCIGGLPKERNARASASIPMSSGCSNGLMQRTLPDYGWSASKTQLENLTAQYSSLQDGLRYRSAKVPQPSEDRQRFKVIPGGYCTERRPSNG